MTHEEKIRVAEENSEVALSFTIGGIRYARCCVCGRTWNISKKWVVPSTGYLCPRCYGERRNVNVQG